MCLVTEGWVFSYQLLRDGSRQVIDFRIPGDFIGINSALLRRRQNLFATITEAEVGEFDQGPMIGMLQSGGRLARAIMWTVSREGAQIEEHLVDLGRRSALSRTAHLLLELGDRLKLVGHGTDGGYACPLSQALLADALGLTPVHVNRKLRDLREMGCLTFRNGYVSFDNLPALVEVAEYDPDYLDHNAMEE